MPADLPRSDDEAALCTGEAVTLCCGAFATFHDDVLCCKSCWREVGLGRVVERLYSLVDDEGYVRFHWRTDELNGRRFAARYVAPSDLGLVDSTGRLIADARELLATAVAS